MGIEIERKFLVDKAFANTLTEGDRITQGYIPTDSKTVVRVRIRNEAAFLTIKGENRGATRAEFEYAIPYSDAAEMIGTLCGETTIDKTRYLVPYMQHTWEVDIFEGNNKGLIVAEIELSTEDEAFETPTWAIQEVTGDPRYYNSNLMHAPYCSWTTD